MTIHTHASALTLDALALGGLDRETAAQVEAHLVSCATCQRDQQAAAALRDQFARSVLPRGLVVRRPWRWAWLALPAFAAALALVLALWPRAIPIPELAIKGDASWQVFANRDGQTFSVRDGAQLAAGDRIRFALSPGGAHYVLVASVDSTGAATIYYPYGGEMSAAIGGERVEPAGSIALDAAPGPERIYAILSDQPVAAADVVAQLREVAAGGAEAIRATRTLRLAARAQLSLVFEKAAP
ncbi:MAG: zf-HC2 domain-containing protein [Kofleriaceae bacterium]